jgi:D-aminoacyl-tRNA deacylase
MPVIVTSEKDMASLNIKNRLLELYDFTETGDFFENSPIYKFADILLITTVKDLIYADHLEENIKADLFVFASRHKSVSGTPALLVHSPGNWTDEALYGGNPRELSVAPPQAIKEALIELANQKEKLDLNKYDVTLEVTHHGPTSMNTPLVFVELGSSEREWKDPVAAEAVAHACIKAAKSLDKMYKIGVGFGGPHYAPQFTKVVLFSEFAVGHIIPNHVFDKIDRDMVVKAVERTSGEVEYALLDWKGLKKNHKDFLIPILEELGLKIERTQRIKGRK